MTTTDPSSDSERSTTDSDRSLSDTVGGEVVARITDGVFAVDEEWRFTYLNEQAERVLRCTDEELLGTTIWEAFPQTVGSAFEQKYGHAMETQEPVWFEGFYEPLETWFEVCAYPSETGLSVYFRDVTGCVRQQAEIGAHEHALRRVYEIIADPDRPFPQQIDALLKVVREVVGTDYATLSHARGGEYVFETVDAPDDADLRAGDTVPVTATVCERVVETGRTLVLEDVEADAPELADRGYDGAWDISCYLGAPVYVGDEVYGTVCFYGDEPRTGQFSDWEVTFVDLLADWVSSELERQRETERLDSFAGMLAHELRNPLQIAQLYQSQAAAGDESAAEEVTTALDRIEELIDLMLVTARGADSVIDWESVELADAATEVWAEVGVDEADLVVDTDRTVEADPVHLHHFLENLFTNAVEHGGRDVTVRVDTLEDGFYVADDGPGIPEPERSRVFEAGFTTENGGIGLGLSFVAHLADTYDWERRVTESDAGGARFEFTGVERRSEQ
ncbi:PAS domain-containing sensor histidine kinase [Halorussus aquaticus]|uniref:histidine kinase n=1 Tax=Halorussus aquaticus TaxID=2953748 RepID=A0ABD5PYD1_9EURY|nr:ATP-binding protein [Halorussus aquaticus]